MGDGTGIPDDPPRGLKARFYEGLGKRPLRHTPSVYRALVFFGYVAASIEFIALSMMYREAADLAPALEGFLAGSAFGFSFIWAGATFLRKRPRLEALAFLIIVMLTYGWLEFWVPRFDTDDGGLALVGFLLGWTLSSAILGNLYFRYMCRLGMTRPAKTLSREERKAMKRAKAILAAEQQKSGALPRLVFCAVLLIATSAGIMIYSAGGMIVDPEANDMHTAEDWLGMIVWLIPMCAAVVVLIIGLLRMEARIMMFSGVLAGFSFLGFFAVAGQLFLWVAHRKYGLPWKNDKEYRVADESLPLPEIEDAGVRLALEQLREERQIETTRRFRMRLAKNVAWTGVTLLVDEPQSNTYLQELRLAERDLDTLETALEELTSRNQKKYGKWLKEAKDFLDATRSARAEEEARLGERSDSAPPRF